MATNGLPYEIIGTPCSIYLAPVSTAFPAIDANPSGSWTLLGKNGNANFSGDGVKITHSQTLAYARPDGVTATVKAWRTEEDLMIEATIWDLTLEQYSFVLNSNSVSTVAASSGVAGNKSINLYRGPDVAQFALLVRGASPYGTWPAGLQYEVPIVVHDGNPTPVFKKGTPAALLCNFRAMADLGSPTTPFGTLRGMTAAAT